MAKHSGQGAGSLAARDAPGRRQRVWVSVPSPKPWPRCCSAKHRLVGLASLLRPTTRPCFMPAGNAQVAAGWRWQSSRFSPPRPGHRRRGSLRDETGDKPERQEEGHLPIIPIAAIRALEDFVFVGSHRNGKRVIVITEAEAMQPGRGNALLKILEEPPASVYFILVSSRPKTLLPTIRSRCRAIPFSAPTAASAQEWIAAAKLPKDSARFLDLAGGAPLRVAQWNEQQIFLPLTR